jgi:hypothetical protein
MYRRQLLQGCRHIEVCVLLCSCSSELDVNPHLPLLVPQVDCWDGRGQIARVTHGHTFVTSIPFPDVAKALMDTAFVTSKFPLIVSLEVTQA